MKNNMSNNNQKKIVTILAVFLSVVSIILLGAGFYLFSNSKTVLLQSISKLTNNTKEIIGESNSNLLQSILKEDKINISSDIKVSMNEEEIVNLGFTYLENKKDEKSAFNFDLSQSDVVLLEGDGYLANNNIYLKIKDIMNYYYTECPYVSLFEDAPIEDYKKVIDLFYESVKEELNEDDIIKSKETIRLGEKEKKVTKLSYKITTKTITNILTNTSDKILKDKELVSSLANAFGVSETEFKESFNSFKEELKELENESLYYNVYYYGFNNIVMYELADDSASIQIYDYDENFEMIFATNEEAYLTLKLVKDNDKYNISGNIDDYTYEGTLKEEDNKLSLDLDITIEGIIFDVKLDQTITEKDNYTVNTKVVVGFVGTSIEIDANTTYAIGNDIDVSGLENAKDFNTITDSDIQNILTNIQNHPFLSSIYELIQSYSGMLEDSSDLDYDYDFDSDYYDDEDYEF